jgi:hypothetical protein
MLRVSTISTIAAIPTGPNPRSLDANRSSEGGALADAAGDPAFAGGMSDADVMPGT